MSADSAQRTPGPIDAQALIRQQVRCRPRHDDVVALARNRRSLALVGGGAVGLLGVATLLAIALGTNYTQRLHVRGALIADLVEITAPARGVVASVEVKPGQEVRRGDRLITTTSDFASVSLGRTADKIAENVARERQQIQAELHAIDENAVRGDVANQAQLALLQEARQQLDGQRSLAADDLIAAKVIFLQISSAAEQGIVSKVQAAEQQSSVLAKELQLSGFARQRNELDQSVIAAREKLRGEHSAQAQRRQQLEERLLAIDRTENDNETSRVAAIVSPLDGFVREIPVRPGETVQASQRLATIASRNSVLILQASVAGPQIAFVKKGAIVNVTPVGYESLLPTPVPGRVTFVATLPEESAPGRLTGGTYRVHIEVPELISTLTGVGVDARPGMSIDVDIPLRRRRVYELLLPEDVDRPVSSAPADGAGVAIQAHSS